MTLREQMGKRLLFFDGALGTGLQAMGLPAGEAPERWLFTQPENILALHRSFLDAGCNILTAATFGANNHKLAPDLSVEHTVKQALALVKQAIRDSGHKAFAALDIGPTGQFLEPFGTLAFEDALSSFAQTIRAGAENGADCIVIETMADTLEMKAAVLAAKENCDLPIFASFSPDANGRLLMGGDMLCCLALLEGLGADAIGLNCGTGPAALAPSLALLAQASATPLFVMPNAGLPHLQNGKTVYSVEPPEFALQMKQVLLPGVCFLGGCCGTAPEHLRALIHACEKISPLQSENTKKRLLSSYAKTIDWDAEKPQIGEEIRPDGAEKVCFALQNQDADALVSLALDQMDDGAEVLSLNLALPGGDEAALYRKLLPDLQMSLPLPLLIETADANALEAALRIYNGNAAVRFRGGSETAAQLVQTYGGFML